MLIDWFTVIAQALNFGILVWLMKRFLYKPVLAAIDAREKGIAARLADAAAKTAEASKERDEFERKNAEFDGERAALMTGAEEEAKTERARLLDEARKAADALRDKRMEALKTELHLLNRNVARWTRIEVFAVARKALADLATTSLEERMGEVFSRRLRELDGGEKGPMAAALAGASAPAVVRSAFDLPADQRAAIRNAINETFSADVPVRFETAPDLVSGVELTANGLRVGWSISGYLASMEKGVESLLDMEDAPPPASGVVQPAATNP